MNGVAVDSDGTASLIVSMLIRLLEKMKEPLTGCAI